ncbi:DNA alkylation repair protein [Agromyces seonyuensis]|uniref:DNA alkylation repair protein n=1 Tax=Agromyces seonyuensis TaxID=2662446 RepID=A0A6I4P1K4_9MICO|nr:DNA alkylation repair protein [Agromyces seonyuensis]MWB97107.1 DNA alkylation repair protein [Agromyces seonyuensis]
MSEAGEFVDERLRYEGDEYRAEDVRDALGLDSYGASVGAVRGTIRDAGNRYRGLGHDEITALASELWSVPVFERRLAAIVLLQSRVRMLGHNDLTRLEGFLREASVDALFSPLVDDVVRPLVDGLDGAARTRASAVLARWADADDPRLRAAAERLSA